MFPSFVKLRIFPIPTSTSVTLENISKHLPEHQETREMEHKYLKSINIQDPFLFSRKSEIG